jgi:hypothetical protein
MPKSQWITITLFSQNAWKSRTMRENHALTINKGLFTHKRAWNSRIAFKRTETAFLGVFPLFRSLHTTNERKRAKRAFPAQERASKAIRHTEQAQNRRDL